MRLAGAVRALTSDQSDVDEVSCSNDYEIFQLTDDETFVKRHATRSSHRFERTIECQPEEERCYNERSRPAVQVNPVCISGELFDPRLRKNASLQSGSDDSSLTWILRFDCTTFKSSNLGSDARQNEGC